MHCREDMAELFHNNSQVLVLRSFCHVRPNEKHGFMKILEDFTFFEDFTSGNTRGVLLH